MDVQEVAGEPPKNSQDLCKMMLRLGNLFPLCCLNLRGSTETVSAALISGSAADEAGFHQRLKF